MSSHFSANQYENAFRPKRLKNWTVPRKYKERPSALEGFTQIIASDRGHLKPAVPRSKESPWGTFMGTWDMPRNIPPARPSYTARSDRAAESLKNFKETSPLNQAVNGYKEFTSKKPEKHSPVQRPAAPTPPTSPIAKEVLQPSAAAVVGNDKTAALVEPAAASPRAKSNPQSPVKPPVAEPAQIASPQGYPSPRKSASPRACSRSSMIKAGSPVAPQLAASNASTPVASKAPTPRGSSRTGRPASVSSNKKDEALETC